MGAGMRNTSVLPWMFVHAYAAALVPVRLELSPTRSGTSP